MVLCGHPSSTGIQRRCFLTCSSLAHAAPLLIVAGDCRYGVPGDDAARFETVFKEHMPAEFAACPGMLHGLVTMLSPLRLARAGVQVCRAEQRPGMFVVTFPQVSRVWDGALCSDVLSTPILSCHVYDGRSCHMPPSNPRRAVYGERRRTMQGSAADSTVVRPSTLRPRTGCHLARAPSRPTAASAATSPCARTSCLFRRPGPWCGGSAAPSGRSSRCSTCTRRCRKCERGKYGLGLRCRVRTCRRRSGTHGRARCVCVGGSQLSLCRLDAVSLALSPLLRSPQHRMAPT